MTSCTHNNAKPLYKKARNGRYVSVRVYLCPDCQKMFAGGKYIDY